MIVILHELGDESPRLLDRQRDVGPDAVPFERAVPPFDLAVGLRVVRTRSHMGHATEPDELLEVFRNELRTIVADDPGRLAGESFPGSLEDDLDVGLLHAFPQFPMNNEPAAAVEHADEVVKRPADVDVAHVDVPVVVGR